MDENPKLSFKTIQDTIILSLVMRKPFFAYAKTKTQISCVVNAQVISAFVFALNR